VEAATNTLLVFNISAIVARQGCPVKLEQSDMRLALNIAKLAKAGFLPTAIEETQYLHKKPRAKVHKEKKRQVGFTGHKAVMAVIQTHPAMHRHNETNGFHPCKNGTAISGKCKSVQMPHPNYPDTPVDLTSASKYFQMLPGPPEAKYSALRLCKCILRCS